MAFPSLCSEASSSSVYECAGRGAFADELAALERLLLAGSVADALRSWRSAGMDTTTIFFELVFATAAAALSKHCRSSCTSVKYWMRAVLRGEASLIVASCAFSRACSGATAVDGLSCLTAGAGKPATRH